jgi:DnaK suppressor protein
MARQTDSIDRERYLLLKGMLEDRRREIHEKLRSLREQVPVDAPDVRDAEEQSVDDFVQEVDLALMQMKSETLKKIDQAIVRLEAGTYGRCQECDAEIPPARLRALPFAALCRDCQEEAESNVRAQREAKAFERLQRELVNVTLRAGARD